MCDKNPYYSSQVMCGVGLGGSCAIGNTSQCICKPGFSHDLTQLRQRDCSLHYTVMPIFCSWYLVGSFIALIMSVKEIRNSTGTAKQILIAGALNSLSCIAFCAYQSAHGYAVDAVSVFFGYLLFSFAFISIYLIVYSLASPLFKMAEIPETQLIKGLRFINFVFRSLGIILSIVAMAAYSDHTNPANDKGWNVIISIMFGLHAIETAIIQLSIQIVGRRMIAAVQLLINLTPDNPNHITTRQYIHKVQDLLRNMRKTSPGFVISWLVPIIIYLATGYFPVFNFVVAFTYFQAPFFCIFVAIYAKRERIKQQQVQEDNLSKQEQNEKLEANNKVLSNYLSSEDDGAGEKVVQSEYD